MQEYIVKKKRIRPMKIYQQIKNLALLLYAAAVLLTVRAIPIFAAEEKPKTKTLFINVHDLDGVNKRRIENANVLVEGDLIKRVRENLCMGATQIKMAAGGGVTSFYEPA